MDNIIVTVLLKNGKGKYDVELPVNVEGGELKGKLFELLNECTQESSLSPSFHTVQINAKQREWKDTETLGQAGVYNGDYLTVVPKYGLF